MQWVLATKANLSMGSRWAHKPVLVKAKQKGCVTQITDGTYDPGKAMQARLLERPQQVNSMKRSANRAEPPRNPAVIRPRMYPPIDISCNSKKPAISRFSRLW